MRVTSITHERTYNTGNYTSQRFGATADLADGEVLAPALAQLASELHAAANAILNPPKPTPPADEEESEIPF